MRLTLTLLLASGIVLVGCNRTQNSAATNPPQSQPKTTIDASTTGSISGTVHFTCAPPAPIKIDMTIVASPLCAVTDAHGNIEIKGLPPGDYTIASVQEKLGERTMTVRVAPHEQKKTVDFSYQ